MDEPTEVMTFVYWLRRVEHGVTTAILLGPCRLTKRERMEFNHLLRPVRGIYPVTPFLVFDTRHTMERRG